MSLRDAGLRALHPGQGTPLTTPLFILGSEKRGGSGEASPERVRAAARLRSKWVTA